MALKASWTQELESSIPLLPETSHEIRISTLQASELKMPV